MFVQAATTVRPRDPKLAWVEVAGEMHHVSSFAHFPPQERPEVRCPECREVLTLKLGPIRAHHAAHRPRSGCAAASADGAARLNERFERSPEAVGSPSRAEASSPRPAASPSLSSLARAILIGRAGADAQLIHLRSETLCRFRLATGNRPEWHRIIARGGLLPTVARGVQKGRLIYVSGTITHRTYVDRGGHTQEITEIEAEAVLFP